MLCASIIGIIQLWQTCIKHAVRIATTSCWTRLQTLAHAANALHDCQNPYSSIVTSGVICMVTCMMTYMVIGVMACHCERCTTRQTSDATALGTISLGQLLVLLQVGKL